MAELFEVGMLISFGASWPMNVIKSFRARTTRGKSLAFLFLIIAGYILGIISKVANPVYMNSISQKWYVLFFYIFNLITVSADLILYIRNYRIDRRLAK